MKICPYMYASVLRVADLHDSFSLWCVAAHIKQEHDDIEDGFDEMREAFGEDEDIKLAENIMEIVTCQGENCGRFNNCNNIKEE